MNTTFSGRITMVSIACLALFGQVQEKGDIHQDGIFRSLHPGFVYRASVID